MADKENNKLILVAIIALAIGIGGGFGICKLASPCCGDKTSCNESKDSTNKALGGQMHPFLSTTIPATAVIREIPSSLTPAHYTTIVLDFKSDSNINNLKSINSSSAFSITAAGSGFQLNSTPTPATNTVDPSAVTYYTLKASTIGLFIDQVYGDDAGGNRIVFKFNNIVRIKRGATDGSVVFGVVNLENTSLEQK